MRYVAACRSGHLADIDWYRWAHQNRGETINCDKATARLDFSSKSTEGASLGALSVDCTSCGAKAPIEGLLGENGLRRIGQKCPGRQPWQPQDDAIDCSQTLQALQRSQTAVHFSAVEAALDIRVPHDHDDPRVEVIEQTVLGARRDYRIPFMELGLLAESLANRATDDLLTDYPDAPPVTSTEVTDAIDRLAAAEDTEEPEEVPSRDDLLLQEWAVLATEDGVGQGDPSAPISVKSEEISPSSPLSGVLDGLRLVDRLREVRAFVGFRRVSPDGDLVYPNLGERRPSWLPAIEVFGEGIFIRFDEEKLVAWERDNADALSVRLHDIEQTLRDPDEYSRRFADRVDVLPRFMLAHTFAHVLILELCYECGYSSASLRERLYVFPDRCGVMIYTADGDSEGSLGGLVRQGTVERLSKTVVAAITRASWCSNDPVCRELTGRGPAKSNLAACHACGLISETSCTDLNGMLDRVLLVGDPDERSPRGYFEHLIDR
jgi:uncharacterized protein DUF1998